MLCAIHQICDVDDDDGDGIEGDNNDYLKKYLCMTLCENLLSTVQLADSYQVCLIIYVFFR